MNAPDHFETALLAQLITYAEERRRARTVQRRIALVGAAAAAATGLALAGFGSQNTPAYSVQEGNDGEVIVTVHDLHDLDDAAALERAIEAHGVKADVTFLHPGTRCTTGRYQVVDRALTGLSMGVGKDEFTVTIPPGTVRDDETFVLSAAHQRLPDSVDAAGNEATDAFSFAVQAELASGSVAPCRVERGDPLPEPPR